MVKMLIRYNGNYSRWHYAGTYESVDRAKHALSIKLNNNLSDTYYRVDSGNVLVSVSSEARDDNTISSYRVINNVNQILLEEDF